MNKYLIWLAAILLLIVDFLSFHDLAESHTLPDWLTLLGSLCVFAYVVLPYFKSKN